jgi:XisH protein
MKLTKSEPFMAKDYFHSVVKAALIQDGWAVTDDPLKIKVGGVDMEIDLGAEQIIAAERQGQKVYDTSSERELLWIPQIILN